MLEVGNKVKVISVSGTGVPCEYLNQTGIITKIGRELVKVKFDDHNQWDFYEIDIAQDRGSKKSPMELFLITEQQQVDFEVFVRTYFVTSKATRDLSYFDMMPCYYDTIWFAVKNGLMTFDDIFTWLKKLEPLLKVITRAGKQDPSVLHGTITQIRSELGK